MVTVFVLVVVKSKNSDFLVNTQNLGCRLRHRLVCGISVAHLRLIYTRLSQESYASFFSKSSICSSIILGK